MTVTGKIKNVVDFGAFVDLGIKETALVHISELCDSFVKDPMSVVKAGDVLEFRIIGLDRDRRRISLSRRSSPAESRGQARPAPPETKHTKQAPVKEAAAPGFTRAGKDKPGNSAPGDNDGTMYNPFAEAFRKMKDKK
jgi:uncharacterized protein